MRRQRQEGSWISSLGPQRQNAGTQHRDVGPQRLDDGSKTTWMERLGARTLGLFQGGPEDPQKGMITLITHITENIFFFFRKSLSQQA